MNLNDLINVFGAKKCGHNEWQACCPSHDDKKASLSIGVGRKNNLLIKCHAGCDNKDIVKAVGLTFKDLYFDEPYKATTYKPKQSNESGKEKNPFDWHNVIATYDYGNGTRKLRDKNKEFVWQHFENGKWRGGRKGIPHILYFNGKPNETLWILEGEKDCDTANMLGLYACSAPCGADDTIEENNKWLPSFNNEIAKLECVKQIYLIPDNDRKGKAFVNNKIVPSLKKTVEKKIRVVDLATVWADIPEHNDLSDMVEVFGQEKAMEMLNNAISIAESGKPSSVPFDTKAVAEMLAKTIKTIDGNEKVVIHNTAENYLTIFRNDPHFANVRFNVMRGYPEKLVNGKRELWIDKDDCESRTYIETSYHIANKQKCSDAFAQFQYERCYHPVQEMIKALTWDNVPRCETFLIKWLGCTDTPYNRECSRLIFSGGINRAFKPSCKFDEIIVLQGCQGSGKSSVVEWLAMDSDYYTGTKTIYGKTGVESIMGKWIVEIPELLATLANEKSGQKTEENAKAFLSTTCDFIRKPYAERPEDIPRNCIFIGTTNRSEFLSDKTGNRRWFPCKTNSNGHEIYRHKAEIQADIKQCWAEMKYYFDTDNPLSQPVANENLLVDIKAEQDSCEVEDWRIGMIAEFLKDKKETCILQVWCEALYPDSSFSKPQRSDSNDISEILIHKLGWIKGKTTYFGKTYGRQQPYCKPEGFQPTTDIDF